MARHALPPRPALKSLSGSGRLAPWAKVSFTLPLWALATAIIPSRDHTGLPIHFHSSIISRSASSMLLRMLANVLPRQSVSSAISRSIRSDGFIGSLCIEFWSLICHLKIQRTIATRYDRLARQGAPTWHWSGSRPEKAGQRRGLLHPVRHLRLVELVAFVDVDVARVLALTGAGRDRLQRRAAEEGHLDVVREGVEPQKPTLALDAVKWRVPLHGLAHVGHAPHDERVQAPPEIALPARHPGDIRLHRGIAVRLCDARVAAREDDGDLLAVSHLDRSGLCACVRGLLVLGCGL